MTMNTTRFSGLILFLSSLAIVSILLRDRGRGALFTTRSDSAAPRNKPIHAESYRQTLTRLVQDMNKDLGHNVTLEILQDFLGGSLIRNPYTNNNNSSSESLRNNNYESVALVSYCVGERYQLLQTLVQYNRQEYANRWGYQVLSGNSNDMPVEAFITPPQWLKAAYMHQLLTDIQNNVDWFLWIDCDALVARVDWNVTYVLQQVLDGVVQPHHHVVVAQDPNAAFNSGVMFVRNCEWSRNLWKRTLQAASNSSVREDKWWEQRALLNLYQANAHGEHDHVYITPHRYKINAMRSDHRNDYNWSSSFVWHRINCHKQDLCNNRSLAFFCAHMPNQSYPKELCSNVPPGTPW